MTASSLIFESSASQSRRCQQMAAIQNRLSWLQPRRVAIIKPSALGDIIHALPVATALRRKFPQAELHWVVNASYASLLQGHPDLDEVVAFDRTGLRRNWWEASSRLFAFGEQLRKRRYDLVVDLQGLLRSGLMAQLSGAPWKMGLRSAREGAGWFYNIRLPDELWTMHAVDRYWLVAEAFGVGGTVKQFRFPTLETERSGTWGKLVPLPRPWVMINLGTRWETKRWPVAHFAALAQHLVMTTGGSVVLVGGAEEKVWADQLQQLWRRNVLSLVGQTTLRELVAVLDWADLVISNDSGPLHLAAALGKPVVSPFTCTSPIRTGPYGQARGVVRTNVPCAASYRKTCSHMSCMSELTPVRVIPILDEMLQQCRRSSA
jgi:heptosyltransferase-1